MRIWRIFETLNKISCSAIISSSTLENFCVFIARKLRKFRKRNVQHFQHGIFNVKQKVFGEKVVVKVHVKNPTLFEIYIASNMLIYSSKSAEIY